MKKKAEIKALKARVEVLEFKERAKGARFILGRCYYGVFREFVQEIKWISEDGERVVTKRLELNLRNEIRFNGNYVEVYRHRLGLVGAYRVKNDDLVDMDIEVYRKTFYPEQKSNDRKETEMKFKVGDRVRVREWDDMEEEFGTDSDGDIKCEFIFSAEMRKYCGNIFSITKAYKGHYFLEGCAPTNGVPYLFSGDMLLPATKFKVGDRVRHEKGLATIVYDDGTKGSRFLLEFDEEIERGHDGEGRTKDGHGWWVREEAIVKVYGETKKIVITSDGEKTTARLYEGKALVKSETARCSPADEFDFGIGAKIAFERLIKSTAKKEEKYYNGKVVCVETKGCYAYTFGKIYELKNGKLVNDNGFQTPETPVKTLDEWNKGYTGRFAKFIPLVE